MVRQAKIISFCLIALFCTISCTKQVHNESSLDTFVLNNVETYQKEHKDYIKQFIWDTLLLPQINCAMYKVRSTEINFGVKCMFSDIEHVSVVVDEDQNKYILRRQPSGSVISTLQDLADLDMFVNKKNSLNRIAYLDKIINFHLYDYGLDSMAMFKIIDTAKVAKYIEMAIRFNTQYVSKDTFCPTTFERMAKLALYEPPFLGKPIFISAYMSERGSIQYWMCRNGINGYWHLGVDEIDTNNYFLSACKFRYKCW